MSTNPRVFSSWIWWEKRIKCTRKMYNCIHDLLDHNRNMLEFIDLLVAWLIWVFVSSYSRKKGPAHILCEYFWPWVSQWTRALTDYNKNSHPCSCGFSPCRAPPQWPVALAPMGKEFSKSTILDPTIHGSSGPRAKKRLQRLNFGWQKWWKTAFGKAILCWKAWWVKANEMGTRMLMYILVIFQGLLIRLWGVLCEQSCQHAIGFFSISVYLGVSLDGGTPNLHTQSADPF